MVKNYIRFILLVSFMFANQMIAQQNDLWRKANFEVLEVEVQKGIELKNGYQAFALELGGLKKQLSLKSAIPKGLKKAGIKVQFPLKNGQLASFWIHEIELMHPDLAKKFPNHKSYKGRGVDDPGMRINLTINALGLHAMIIEGDGTIQYIDPLKLQGEPKSKYYQVYRRADIVAKKQGFNCEVQELGQVLQKQMSSVKSHDTKLRTYGLALAATGEYSQYHIADQNAQDLSDTEKRAIVHSTLETAINRINEIFLNDLAIRMQLVGTNDELIFLDPDTDPYSTNDMERMLGQNQTTCDKIIGDDGYDIGHVFSTAIEDGEGGAVLGIGTVCATGSKAKGATGATNPKGDGFLFDYVAHEFGHQFGANHTFNGDADLCGRLDQRNAETSVEPGSGSTLMAYAGLCSPQNVQLRSDLYFHSVSIAEIWGHVSGAGESCAEITDLSSNANAPVADAGDDFTIPIGTPFKLLGEGQDADGDILTYCWEQIDNRIGRVPPRENDRIGTQYRSYPPVENNTRYLPALKELRNGNISTKWEVTPTVARELNFGLTVRDNHAEAGQTATDKIKVIVTNVAGPFRVTSQNTEGLVWEQNSDQQVAWDVAGTDANGVNVSKVNILLSTDGGLTYPTVLIENTDNDGVENIRVPFFTAGSCYVMVEAVDNFFFALNQKSFSIGEDNNFCDYRSSTDVPLAIPDNDLQGIVSEINIEEDLNIENIDISVNIEHTFIGDLSLEIESPEGTKILLIKEACWYYADDINAVFKDQGEGISCSNSVPGISGDIVPSEFLSSFAGENAKGQWKLRVIDGWDDGTGKLLNWGMTICSFEEVLSAKQELFKGFKIYPNPAETGFEISFVLRSENVQIYLYDGLGRRVMQKAFQSNDLQFSEHIPTDHLKGGVYFLRVVNGSIATTETLIIK